MSGRAKALELSIDHDAQPVAEGLTLLHAEKVQERGIGLHGDLPLIQTFRPRGFPLPPPQLY